MAENDPPRRTLFGTDTLSEPTPPGAIGNAPSAKQPAAVNAIELPTLSAPALTLPKGGGAIRGMGEKFSANPATGAGSLSIPVYTSPGRSGAQPTLTVDYNSGAGNSPFGLGFSLSIPSIARRTGTRLPEYRDQDVFVLSGAEDLVPSAFHGIWNHGTRTEGNFLVACYQPRVDTLFARIERWTDLTSGDCYWRAFTRDNLLNVYGQSASARVVDPADPTRVFRWLLESTTDARGNVVCYRYRSEDGVGVAPAIYEQRRRGVNVYPDRILYGNRAGAPDGKARPDHPEDWLFEVVFDYGERAAQVLPQSPDYVPPAAWSVRPDPFSNFKPGFELRTYRLCRRVLMFHRIDDPNTPVLVRSTEFDYAENPDITFLSGVTQTGYDPAQTPAYQQLPALSLTYTAAIPDSAARPVDADTTRNLPYGIDEASYKWVDFDDEGLAGVLTEQATGWFYKRNQGSARLGGAEHVMAKPASANLGAQALVDLEQDGHKYLVQWGGATPGSQARLADGTWGPFTAFISQPLQRSDDANARLLDLDGDGRADLLVSEDTVLRWYPSQGVEGFGPSLSVPKPWDEDQGPALVFADAEQALYLADMSGDGLSDIVRIRNGDVCYWPNLGFGRFGPKITMGGAPVFDAADRFDQRRIILADVDGSGTTDIIYLDGSGARYWLNCAGNRFDAGHGFDAFPGWDRVSQVEALDLLGNGTSCLVWSSRLPVNAGQPLRYLALTGGIKPHLLDTLDNGRGLTTQLTWGASTEFYLADRRAGRPWPTRIPFPVAVVKEIQVTDQVTGDQLTTRYPFHHGYYEAVEHEFRGFGLVEQWDAEAFDPNAATGADVRSHATVLNVPPTHVKTWFHTGAFIEGATLESVFASEYYQLSGVFVAPLADSRLENVTTALDARQATRALAGKVLRREVYADDAAVDANGNPLSTIPYEITTHNYQVKALQPAAESQYGIYIVSALESLSFHLERNPSDPRLYHEVVVAADDFGNITDSVSVAYPRRAAALEGVPGQDQLLATHTRSDVANAPGNNDWYRVGVPYESRTWEVRGFDHAPAPAPAPALTIGQPSYPWAVVAQATAATAIPYEAAFDTTQFQRRLVSDAQILYRADDGQTELGFGAVTSLGLPSRTRQLAFSQALLDSVFDPAHALPPNLLTSNGYQVDAAGYWIQSNAVSYGAAVFFQPTTITDPSGNAALVAYDAHALFAARVTDGLANVTQAAYDSRALQLRQLLDANGNQSLASFDPLGRLVATAQQGKAPAGNHPPAEGDTLAGATTRFAYHLEALPNLVICQARESHEYPDHVGEAPDYRFAYLYYDGFGRQIMSKVEDDDGQPPTQMSTRWVGTGRTVYNNKGMPVKQYEPYFSGTNAFESEQSLVASGETSVTHYDPLDRVIRLDRPNGTFALVEFDVWTRSSYDENDTLAGHGPNAWYARFGVSPPTTPQQVAAVNAFEHRDTPTVAKLDVLGRLVQTRLTNVEYPANVRTTVEYPRTTTLDIEGNTLAMTAVNQQPGGSVVTVAVVTRTLDMLGRPLLVQSADAGSAWSMADCAGQAVCAYDARGYRVVWGYDPLRRLLTRRVLAPGALADALAEQYVYGEGLTGLSDETGAPATAQALNLLGRRYRQKDAAGVLTSVHYDFKGNLLFESRQVRVDYTAVLVDWSGANPLDPTVYLTARTADALNRLVTLETPDGDPVHHVAGTLTTNGYGKHLLLRTVTVTPSGSNTAQPLVQEINYNERGQRKLIRYGNGVSTSYGYEPDTLRLSTLTTVDATATALQGLTFYYDPVGNVAHIDDSATPTVTYNGGAVPSSQGFVYDALYRLTQATGREHIGQTSSQDQTYGYNLPAPTDLGALRAYAQNYAYDRLGNFSTFQHQASVGGGFTSNWTRHYETDASSNRLLSTSANSAEPGPHYGLQYLYDIAGNLTRLPYLGGAPGAANCIWNDRSQLVSAVLDVTADPNDATDHAYYIYDAAGQRVRKVVVSGANVRRERIYLGAFERFRHYSGNTVTERRTVHVMDERRRLALIDTKQGAQAVVRYQHDNQVRSAVFELDSNGRTLSREEYHPFGTTSFHIAPSSLLDLDIKRYRYTGKERDDETGLYYAGARYFAPWLGRWISCDPGGTGDGPNLYAYTHDNPVRFLDPSGRQAKEDPNKPTPPDEIPIPESLLPDPAKKDDPVEKSISALVISEYRLKVFLLELEFAKQAEEREEKLKQAIEAQAPPGGIKKFLADEEAKNQLRADQARFDYMAPKPDKVTPGIDVTSGGSFANIGGPGIGGPPGQYGSFDYLGVTLLPRNAGIRPGGRTYRSSKWDDPTDLAYLKEPGLGFTLSQHYHDPGDAAPGAPAPKSVTHLAFSGQVDVVNSSKGLLEGALTLQAGYDITGRNFQFVAQAGLKVTLADPTKPLENANALWKAIPVLGKSTLRWYLNASTELDVDLKGHPTYKPITLSSGLLLEFGH